MMMSEARSCALMVVLMVSATLVGCGGERSTVVEGPAPAREAPDPASSVPAAKSTRPSDVTVFPDGSSEIGPRITDVAMLKRLPNGTFARTCGAPDPETRTMMEGVMRARMGSRR